MSDGVTAIRVAAQAATAAVEALAKATGGEGPTALTSADRALDEFNRLLSAESATVVRGLRLVARGGSPLAALTAEEFVALGTLFVKLDCRCSILAGVNEICESLKGLGVAEATIEILAALRRGASAADPEREVRSRRIRVALDAIQQATTDEGMGESDRVDDEARAVVAIGADLERHGLAGDGPFAVALRERTEALIGAMDSCKTRVVDEDLRAEVASLRRRLVEASSASAALEASQQQLAAEVDALIAELENKFREGTADGEGGC